jgi:hypothetical protein
MKTPKNIKYTITHFNPVRVYYFKKKERLDSSVAFLLARKQHFIVSERKNEQFCGIWQSL